jgi:hypothetical protein
MTENLIELDIVTKDNFFVEIDNLEKNYNISTMEAIVYYCERNNLEIETAAAMIKSNARVKSRLQSDAENLNFLPKRAKLQF